MSDSIEKYLSFIEGETDLPGLLEQLREDIPCERAVLHMPPEDPVAWLDNDETESNFPLSEAIWEKAGETGRGLVGFNQPGLDEAGPTGTLNVNCVRVCLCGSVEDDDGNTVIRAYLDKRCSDVDFSEEHQALLNQILNHIRDYQLAETGS